MFSNTYLTKQQGGCATWLGSVKGGKASTSTLVAKQALFMIKRKCVPYEIAAGMLQSTGYAIFCI